MSGLALGWAKKQDAPCATSKALLVLLGDYADEDGFAWPSISRMAKEMQRSDRHVSRLLKSLTDAGLLYGFEVVDAGNGRTRPRVYFYPIGGRAPAEDELRAYEDKIGGRVTRVSSPPGPENGGEGDTGVMGEGDTGVIGGMTRESSLELPLNPERDLTISLDACARNEALDEDRGFATALAAYPATGRGITDVESARLVWADALTSAGGSERLLGAVVAFAADPMLAKRDFGAPSFQRWLKEGRWRVWLGDAAPAERRAPWTGPDAVRAAVEAAMGPDQQASYFEPSRWDEARRAIVTRTGYAADRLRQAAGQALRALDVGIECEAGRHGQG